MIDSRAAEHVFAVREVDEADATSEELTPCFGDGERQMGLANAAGPAQRHQLDVLLAEQAQHRCALRFAVQEWRRLGGRTCARSLASAPFARAAPERMAPHADNLSMAVPARQSGGPARAP